MNKRTLKRWTGLGTLTTFTIGAVFVGACAQILGVNDGLPFADGGDATTDHTVGEAGDGRTPQKDGGSDVLGDSVHPLDVVVDVVCVQLENYCTMRCGERRNNCDADVDCGTCSGGLTCSDGGGCGCDPDSVSETCGAMNCGTATNNCGQMVACGVHGTAMCEHPTDVCLDGGTCCTPPAPAALCGNQCGTNAMACGEAIPCTCDDGGLCLSNSCCYPDKNSDWCRGRCGILPNNCGVSVNCGGCDGGVCGSSNTCGCVPNSADAACAGQTCGFATNSCGSTVECGLCSGVQVCDNEAGSCCSIDASACGTSVCNTNIKSCGRTVACGDECNGGEVCLSTDKCCTPQSIPSLCTGEVCGKQTNNCGQQVPCTCGDGGVCDASVKECCFDNGNACQNQCSGTALNNCKQIVTCTDNCTGVDICADGGTTCCTPNGNGCTKNANCCNGNCNPSGDAGSKLCCNPSSTGSCMTNTDCCSMSCNTDAGMCN